MSPKEHLIERLRALCSLHGVETVADETESSLENLKQILAGTKLPSGAPRGVGPNLQKRLDGRYPGWSALNVEPRHSDVRAALPVVLQAIAGLTVIQWEMVRGALDKLPGHPEMAQDVAEAILPTMAPALGKPRAAGP